MDITDFSKKLKDFQKVYEYEENLLPFHFNVIDELHANENAHSRILQKLLLYKRKNEYPFLLSFLENFLSVENNIIEPVITCNQEYIDILIEDQKSDFACIIENKIHWATDQSEQIARYIKTVKKHGKKNISVIYLTRDGSKQVSDESFTDEAQKILEYEDEKSTGNFIPLNYREHILPWLKEEILNNCTYKDQKMIAGIVQYIDHLEGMFNIREDKKKMDEELIKNIRKNFNISGATVDDFEKLAECQKWLNTFQAEMDNLKQKMIQENPWNQPPTEKAIWLARYLKKFFNDNLKQIYPFTKIWIYQSTVVVLDKWSYKGNTFAIDIHCEKLPGLGISIFGRTCGNEVCEQNFSSFFEKYQWKYQDNWRYLKLYEEITNNDAMDKFIKDITKFLQDLKELQDSEGQ